MNKKDENESYKDFLFFLGLERENSLSKKGIKYR